MLYELHIGSISLSLFMWSFPNKDLLGNSSQGFKLLVFWAEGEGEKEHDKFGWMPVFLRLMASVCSMHP